MENALREYLCNVRNVLQEKEIIDYKAVVVKINETEEQCLKID
jgi:hypothetical protein